MLLGLNKAAVESFQRMWDYQALGEGREKPHLMIFHNNEAGNQSDDSG